MQLNLIDKDGKITELISPGVVVDDILGRKATVYLGFQDTAFPQDFIVVFNGIIDEVSAGSNIVLNIAHPEARKRSEIFQPRVTKLASSANFRSAVIQSIKYQTRRGVVGTVTVEYTNTGTAGSEVVTVVGNAISIAIQSGVSTATQLSNFKEVRYQVNSGTTPVFGERYYTATSGSSNAVITVVGERKSGLQCGKCGGTGFVKPDDVSLYEHILALNEYFECNIFGV
jgi:hypothetical protein